MRHLKPYKLFESSKFTDDDVDNLVQIIKDKCQPFIHEFSKYKEFPYRGGRPIKGTFKVKKTRKDRTPLDTPESAHKYLNEAFYDKFGLNLRSESVFTSMNEVEVATYGKTYIFIPIGEYNYYFSNDIIDLTNSVELTYLSEKVNFKEIWEKGESYFIGDLNTYVALPSNFEDVIITKYQDNYPVFNHYGYENLDESLIEKVNLKERYGSYDNFVKVESKRLEEYRNILADAIIHSYQKGSWNNSKIGDLKIKEFRIYGDWMKNEIMFECDEYLLINPYIIVKGATLKELLRIRIF